MATSCPGARWVYSPTALFPLSNGWLDGRTYGLRPHTEERSLAFAVLFFVIFFHVFLFGGRWGIGWLAMPFWDLGGFRLFIAFHNHALLSAAGAYFLAFCLHETVWRNGKPTATGTRKERNRLVDGGRHAVSGFGQAVGLLFFRLDHGTA
ncbi:hypothetical protein B0T22DRAFT_290421 [Podospora appendiculata]|uniref:Uncharacterized protein n=1 Tax=Podospora appendiculata TaxID=314037 RepID=A0AAE0X1E8_9PEZI|nr:hypothetical protein B0T22DRAFT_290421 [Podospora appendiculata]